MPKVVLVNPSLSTVGYSFITPRWLYVLAQATPFDLVGDPVLVDESIERFDSDILSPGDIVGIGISSGNCLPGYRVLTEAKLKARWDLLDPTRYMFPSVQTVAGCPENCSFCSVWVTEGRQPRLRLDDKVIEEVNELHALGFRYLVFADDNFNPSTLGRIAREPNQKKRREFEKLREDRLRFFEEYDRSVPKDMFGFAQMTTEATSDEEYLRALYRTMRIKTALIE